VPSLCVVSPGRLAVTTDGRVQVDPKTAAGLERYAASWPGDVHFVARRGPLDERSQPFDWPRAEDLSFGVSVVDDVTGTVRALSPSVVLAPLELDSAPLLSLDARCVLVCDYPLRVRWDNVRLDPRLGSLDRLRTAAGLGRRAVGLRRMIRRAAGLQCNGPDTWATYAHHSRNPLLYLDTRVTSDEVAQARRTPVAPDGVLRLAFSGRWIEQKGVLDAVEVVERLRADGAAVHLTLLGGGPLESRLRRHEDADVSVVGRLDFTTQWVPHVRDHVDVMVLPHPQGDSASTFLESMSCGTPVAGYDNRYWRALHADSGGGWTTPVSDTRALAALLASLADDRDELARARSAGLEFDRRVEHLLSVTA
jgi:glycosyltransferase involved in cell wall biosynthesis